MFTLFHIVLNPQNTEC